MKCTPEKEKFAFILQLHFQNWVLKSDLLSVTVARCIVVLFSLLTRVLLTFLPLISMSSQSVIKVVLVPVNTCVRSG